MNYLDARDSTAPPGAFTAGAHPRTDAGNADRFAEQNSGRLLWVDGMGWLAWDGKRWARDLTNEVRRRAIQTARSIYVEAAQITASAAGAPDPEKVAKEGEAMSKHAASSEAGSRIEATIKLGAANEALVLRGGARALDPDPWALNVANGVLDLKTFELRPHDPAEHHTRVAAAEYRPGAASEEWDRFVARVIPSPAVRSFVQRALGRALVGEYSEELLIPWGSGKNGKSVFLRAVRAAMGDYAMEGDPELLIQHGGRRSEGEKAAVAELQGRRFVTTIETAEGARLHETFVKQLTGESVMKAKFMRQNLFEFENQATFALATNHKPVIHGNDVAIWERLRLVPFDVFIPKAERDVHLGRRLESRGNAAAVLLWLVEGLMNWQAEGIGDLPPEVAAATEAYKDEMDPLSDWLRDEVEPGEGGAEPISWVYASYVDFCGRTNAPAMPQTEFNASLESRGFIRPPNPVRVHGKQRKVWRGLSLRDSWQMAYLENQSVAVVTEADAQRLAQAEEDEARERLKRDRMRAAAAGADEPKGFAR